jgi:hypothetical protein
MKRRAYVWHTILIVCLSSGCAAADQSTAREYFLNPEETNTYHYELVENLDDAVCSRMNEVYNREFKQPWNFRAFFRSQYPQVAHHHYDVAPLGPITDEDRFLWAMRYALYPMSPQFEAVSWRLATLQTGIGNLRMPIRLSEIDLRNDKKPVLVVQVAFYGFGDSKGASDILNVQQSGSLPKKDIYTSQEILNGKETITGDILRPLILDGLTYLSEYRSSATDEDFPLRHIEPEAMLIKKYIGGQRQGAPMNAELICKFDMQRIAEQSPQDIGTRR